MKVYVAADPKYGTLNFEELIAALTGIQTTMERLQQLARYAVAIVLGFCFAPAAAHADFITGNQLLEKCTSANYQVQCDGYIEGVVDRWGKERLLAKLPVCLPPDTEEGQIHDAVVSYLQANPALRTYGAADLIVLAINLNWHCK